MDANNWVGWACFALVVLVTLAVLAGRLAGEWGPIMRWFRVRRWAFTNAEALRLLVLSEEQARLDIARVRRERETLRQVNGRLEREVERLRARERSKVTVLQMPRLVCESSSGT